VITARIRVSFDKVSHDQQVQFYQQLMARISSLPGVRSASAGWPLPMSNNNSSVSFSIQGRPVAKGDESSESIAFAMPGYFESMRIPLVAGRTFGEHDGLKGAPTTIVNRAFANKSSSGFDAPFKRLPPAPNPFVSLFPPALPRTCAPPVPEAPDASAASVPSSARALQSPPTPTPKPAVPSP
jgi:hypothetical protein